MSMQPEGPGEIPAETVRVARAAFPKGSLAIRVWDELGPMFRDEDFSEHRPLLVPRQAGPSAENGQNYQKHEK